MAIKDLTQIKRHLFICNGSSCQQNGAEETTKTIRAEIKALGLHNSIHTTKTLCNGRCDDGVIIIVAPDNVWYKTVSPKIGKEIVYRHLKHQQPLEDFILWRHGDESIKTE